MTQAQSAEMVFSTNRSDKNSESYELGPSLRTARRDLARRNAVEQDPIRLLLDRMEQLEFALAEAVLRSDTETVTPPDPRSELVALSDRIDALGRQMARSVPAELPLEKMGRILDRLDAAAAARADETTMIANRLEALERVSETRLAPLESTLTALSENLQQDRRAMAGVLDTIMEKFGAISGLEEWIHKAARETEGLRIGQDRLMEMIATLPQSADLSEQMAEIVSHLQSFPEPVDVSSILVEISRQIAFLPDPQEKLTQITDMLSSLANDVKQGQDIVPDIAALRDPLLDRIDRLDTTADQRQRDVASSLAELSARPFPVTDLTPVKESFDQLVTELQFFHQHRESADADLRQRLDVVGDDVATLPEQLKANENQRYNTLLSEITTLAERPILAADMVPDLAPDLASMRENMESFMVALQVMEQNRANTEGEMIARISALAEQITGLCQTAMPEQMEAMGAALRPLQAALDAANEGVQSLTDRPQLELNGATMRDALADQVTEVTAWMERQERLQTAMSDLLGTLVERGAGTAKGVELAEELKALMITGHASARQQLDDVEMRLSAQLSTIVDGAEADDLAARLMDAVSGKIIDVVCRADHLAELAVAEKALALHGDDQRLLDAITALRGLIGSGETTPSEAELENHTRELRIALAENLAAMQAQAAVKL